MVWNLQEDLISGKEREYRVVKYLNENIYMDDKLNIYKDDKKQVDFRNSEIIGELKSRFNKYDKYDTTFFGYNKLKYLEGLENEDRVWKFYFLFTDGLYVWTYNKDQYTVESYDHRERGYIPQVYIPIKYLECLTKKYNSLNIINQISI